MASDKQNGSSASSGNSNSSNNSNFNFDFNHIAAQQALADHEQNLYNSMNKPSNGVFDKFEGVRIRTAVIENYTIKVPPGEKRDPLNIDHTINMKNGQVVIRWINYSGGIVRPDEFGYPQDGYTEPWSYFPEKDSKYPEHRTLDCYNHDKASDKEMISLSHAFMWSNETNWCGINHLPPVGSIVIVGFKKGNIPIILGYLDNHFETNKPFLKPGETIIKGYGNNSIHWRWSNKLDINVKSQKGEIDVDDPYKKDTYPNTIDMWMRFDAYTRNISISLNQTDPDENRKTIIDIKPETFDVTLNNLNTGKETIFNLSTEGLYGSSSDPKNELKSEFNIEPDKIEYTTTGTVNITAGKEVNITGKTVNINS
jgi:hypothetical protein